MQPFSFNYNCLYLDMFFCKGQYKTKFHSLISNSLLRYQNNQKRFGVCNVYFTIV